MDYFGQVVNRASRICSVSFAGETAMSAASRDLLSSSADLLYTFKSTGSVELKGVKDPVEIISVMPQELAGRLVCVSAHRGKKRNSVVVNVKSKRNSVAFSQNEHPTLPGCANND